MFWIIWIEDTFKLSWVLLDIDQQLKSMIKRHRYRQQNHPEEDHQSLKTKSPTHVWKQMLFNFLFNSYNWYLTKYRNKENSNHACTIIATCYVWLFVCIWIENRKYSIEGANEYHYQSIDLEAWQISVDELLFLHQVFLKRLLLVLINISWILVVSSTHVSTFVATFAAFIWATSSISSLIPFPQVILRILNVIIFFLWTTLIIKEAFIVLLVRISIFASLLLHIPYLTIPISIFVFWILLIIVFFDFKVLGIV